MLWLNDGKLVVNSRGQPRDCGECPCDDTFTRCCGTKRTVHKTLRVETRGWANDTQDDSLRWVCLDACGGFDDNGSGGTYDLDFLKQQRVLTQNQGRQWPTYYNWYLGHNFDCCVNGADSYRAQWAVRLNENHDYTNIRGAVTVDDDGISHMEQPYCSVDILLSSPEFVSTRSGGVAGITFNNMGEPLAFPIYYWALFSLWTELCDSSRFKFWFNSYLVTCHPPTMFASYPYGNYLSVLE